ncbi:MAG: M24 family metallopeptidase, partial [Candidatus Nanohaloarchaea archaeon]|nr:M24 family metallopeptidase [Candidatus Nanohaloarchaea archaeon]
GMQEWGMVKVVDSTFREHHAYNAFPTIAHVNTEEPHRPPSARMAADGDLVLVDLGCRVDGYCSDMTRMVPNQVSGERRELLDAVATIQEEVMERVEAGREKAELARFAEDRADALGYDVDEHYLHSLGHGVGVAIHERPMLTPSSEGVLEEGMVVTIEPGLYVPDVGGVRIEDQVVVREEGCERLTQAPRIYDR